jgi:vacuolar iron transporter family protein
MNGVIAHEPQSRRPSDVLRHYLGDLVYGANDGLVTTFTIISGAVGASLAPHIVVILGFVNLLADGFSMGASNYLAIRASADAEGRDRGRREPLMHALVTFASFVGLGVAPLLAFLVPAARPSAFLIGAIVAALVLFAVGALRGALTNRRWWRGGAEMLSIGAVASAVAYAVGALAARLVVS